MRPRRYPIAPLGWLKPDRPNEFSLLGMSLVVWRPPGGTWSVLEV